MVHIRRGGSRHDWRHPKYEAGLVAGGREPGRLVDWAGG